jgi:hypothetical protein
VRTNNEPLVIFSLPRAGSTLLQRILGTHREISTVAEPWLLLPYLYTLRHKGCYAEYGHNRAVDALEDLCRQLPDGRQGYIEELRNFITRIYGKLVSNEARYFVDKTPRYHLVVEDIVRMFPDAKHIFLWRNPLAVIASLMDTWGRGHWNLYHFKVDLFDGLSNLIAAAQTHSAVSHTLRYEDLISDTERECHKAFDYLGIPFDSDLLEDFSRIQLEGRMGDKAGTHYQKVSREPLDKWRRTLASPTRKAWCRRYLKWIGEERLQIMGYELSQLLSDLDSIPRDLRKVPDDLARITLGIANCALEPRIVKHKLQVLPRWRNIHVHT